MRRSEQWYTACVDVNDSAVLVQLHLLQTEDVTYEAPMGCLFTKAIVQVIYVAAKLFPARVSSLGPIS